MKNLFVIILYMALHSCVEPFQIEQTTFRSYIVIEANLTNENKIQEVSISRTFPLDTVLFNPERNAEVLVNSNNGDSYSFTEAENGLYVSNTPFAAASGISYTLSVKTSDGNTYVSEASLMPALNEISEVYASKELKEGEEEGLFIYVDSFDPTGQSKYYRYEYEETFKIIAPFWSPEDAFVVSPLPNPQVDVRRKTREERVCYSTIRSNAIIQKNTTGLSEDRVSKFPVRFISKENYMISHRYSILVKQFVQTRAAFSYYETLEALSSSGSLFTQIQSGFLEGNIKSLNDTNEKVIGFFQASSVSEKRLFFNFIDFFLGEPLPDYPFNCNLVSPPLIKEGPASPLIDAINLGTLKFYEKYDQEGNPNNYSEYGPFLMIQTPCGDCTVLGGNSAPDFWIED